MKQSLSFRLVALFGAVLISSVLLESVAQLGHPVAGVNQSVASVTTATPNPAQL